jgi:putative flippase GtrA
MQPVTDAVADSLQIARFSLVGLVNTALTYSIIVGGLFVGLGDFLANILGYAAGLILSYFLNSRWTFRGARAKGTLLRFLIVFAAAYAGNAALILSARAFGYLENPFIHLLGMGVYTVIFYVFAATYVFGAVGARILLARLWPELTVAIALAIAWLLMVGMPLTHDVFWQMWIARQLLGGATLYVDVMEVNPPLWFWLAMPVVKAAQFLRIDPGMAMVTAIVAYAGISLLAIARIVSDYAQPRRALLLFGSAIALLLIPLSDFAQREHLALIAAVPYALLIARRAERTEVSATTATLTGVVAAVGLALKHYFSAVPVFLELWLLYTLGRRWNPLRPEALVLVLCAIVYIAAIFTLTPAYLSNMVPMLRIAYSGYEAPFMRLFQRPEMLVWSLASVTLVLLRKHGNKATVTFGLAAAGFMLAYLAQQKGWRYHTIPATGFVFLSLITLLDLRNDAVPTSVIWLVAATVVSVASLPLQLAFAYGTYRNADRSRIETLLRDAPPGSPVLMLTPNPSRIWPMVEEQGHVWPSRYFGFWVVSAIAKEERLRGAGHPTPALTRVAAIVQADTVNDILCHPPSLILVDDMSRSQGGPFDLVAFFSENETFRKIFSNYERGAVAGPFTAYVKRDEWNPKAPVGCRTIY